MKTQIRKDESIFYKLDMIKVFILLVIVFTVSSANDIKIDNFFTKAKKSNSHVLIFLHKPNCIWCKRMIGITLENKKVARKIKKDFIFVDINIADTGEVTFKNFKGTKRDFAKYLGYDFYPSTIFMNKDKDMVYSRAGFKKEEVYLKILRFVSSRSYKEIGIDDFK